MKQESNDSPSSTALASRIARYSYETTPSPNGKRKAVTPIKKEVSNFSPHFTRRREPIASPVASVGTSTIIGVVRSPHFANQSSAVQVPVTERAPSAGPSRLDSDDDLESIDGEGGPSDRAQPTRTSRDGLDDDYESDGLGDLVSDDSDEENEEESATASRQSQTRIKARRAGRTERHLGQEDSSTDRSRGKRKKNNGEREERNAPKKKKKARAYAAPEIYQHLRPLPDILAPNLNVIFCGINPGVRSSTTGHHFGHPTNKFWRSLHLSGMTSRLIKPEEDHLLPSKYSYGLTVLVDRPTAEQSELSTHEMRLSVLPFTEKLIETRPGVVCFVGKKIWDVYESVISKTATIPNRTGPGVKEEVDVIRTRASEGPLSTQPAGVAEGTGIQEDIKPTIVEAPLLPPTPSPRRRKLAGPKAKFDWTKPRGYRLQHQNGFTYFWVVPNTSGLERTPLAEQIVLFGHLNSFKEKYKAGDVGGIFRNIDLDGVKQTVDGLRIAAEARLVKQE